MKFITGIANHHTVSASPDVRTTWRGNIRNDFTGNPLTHTELGYNFSGTTAGIESKSVNFDNGLPMDQTLTSFSAVLRQTKYDWPVSTGNAVILKDSTENHSIAYVESSYGSSGHSARARVFVFDELVHSYYSGPEQVHRWDIEMTIDGTQLLSYKVYMDKVLQASGTKQLTVEQATCMPDHLLHRCTSYLSTSYGRSGVYSGFAVQGETSLNKDVMAVELGTDGSFSDFIGNVTDINDTTLPPTAQGVTTSVAGSVSTFNTKAIPQDQIDFHGVRAVGMSSIASASLDVPNLRHVVSDGVTVENLGESRDVTLGDGGTCYGGVLYSNPFTGVDFTMQEVNDLEFGFKAEV